MLDQKSQCGYFSQYNLVPNAKQSFVASISVPKTKKTGNQKNISEDDEFQPEYHTMKKLKLPINRKRLSKGNWTVHENKIYLAFLINNKTSFVDEATRRQERVFCKLSALLNKKRTPDQCRSHHFKLISNLNNSIEDLIVKVGKKIENKQLNKTGGLCKLQEKEIMPLKIEQQVLNDTGLSNSNFHSHGGQGDRDRGVERVIERDFYRLSFFSKERVLLLQISQESMKVY